MSANGSKRKLHLQGQDLALGQSTPTWCSFKTPVGPSKCPPDSLRILKPMGCNSCLTTPVLHFPSRSWLVRLSAIALSIAQVAQYNVVARLSISSLLNATASPQQPTPCPPMTQYYGKPYGRLSFKSCHRTKFDPVGSGFSCDCLSCTSG